VGGLDDEAIDQSHRMVGSVHVVVLWNTSICSDANGAVERHPKENRNIVGQGHSQKRQKSVAQTREADPEYPEAIL
jgi:hypothetical protein